VLIICCFCYVLIDLNLLSRSRGIFKKLGLKDFERTHVTVIGHEENYSSHFRHVDEGPRDVALWMSVHHSDKKALEIWAREIASSGTGMTPGNEPELVSLSIQAAVVICGPSIRSFAFG